MRKIALYLLVVMLLAAMVFLGCWQLSRADEKRLIQERVLEQSQVQLNLNESLVSIDSRYQQAHGLGRFIGVPILVENQSFNGRAGYHVLSAFKLDITRSIILVNLGWAPMGVSRSVKPKVTLPEGEITLKGRLQNPHSKPPIWNENTPIIQQGAWQYLSIEKFKQLTGYNLVQPLILELDKSLDNVVDLEREWLEYDDQWINRHKAYALQWFSMAIALFILCLVIEFRSRRKVNRTSKES